MPQGAKIFAGLALLLVSGASRADAQCGPPDESAPAVRDSLLVSAEWLAQRHNDPALVVLHVGDGAEFAAGHIPGARLGDAHHFTVGEHDLPPAARLDSAVEALGISNSSRVVLYGSAWMTGWMYLVLDYLGHGDRTAILDGGLAAWRAAGRQVATGAPAPVGRAAFTPRLRAEGVVDAAWLHGRLRDERVVVLDVRTAEEYAGRARESLPRTGHIPGARLLDWSHAFERPADAEQGRDTRLKPVAELRRLFRAAGVQAGVAPVTYCTVGMRASQIYFVLRYLGYDAKIYDGSMSDWSRRSELPLVTGDARGNP